MLRISASTHVENDTSNGGPGFLKAGQLSFETLVLAEQGVATMAIEREIRRPVAKRRQTRTYRRQFSKLKPPIGPAERERMREFEDQSGR